MAESFNLITRKQAQKLDEQVGLGGEEILDDLAGLVGEVVMRRAQERRNHQARRNLHDALGAFLATFQLYALADGDGAFEEIMEGAKGYMEKIRAQCEDGRQPSLMARDDEDWI